MRLISNTNLLLFDGHNDKFYEYKILLIQFKEFATQIHFCDDFGNLKNIISSEQLESLLQSQNRIIKGNNGYFYCNNGLGLYFKLFMHNDKKYLLLLSAGEKQPGRYQIYLEGVWEVE